jgi:hypothetical protein
MVLIVAGTTLAWRPWSGGGGGGDKIFETSTAQVSYEVDGTGTSNQIQYVNGPDNQTATQMQVKLPWRTTVSIPVGLAGAVAYVTVANPSRDGRSVPLTCRILLGNKKVRQTTSVDGYSEVGCSTPLQPREQK